ncbi:MAG: hypothetical protein RLZZ223_669 [Candidatus Parcubacteria bacterium]|jgi:hypothetical protein
MLGFRAHNGFARLKMYNGIMGALHFFQAGLMLYVSKEALFPVTTNYLDFDSVTRSAAPVTEKFFDINLGPAVALFLLLSALAHFITILPSVYPWYIKNLKNHINVIRWYEYALSSSVMIVLISLLVGIYDFSTLLLLFGINASMNLFGLVMEQINQDRKEVNWLPYIFGCIAGIIPWIVIFLHFQGAISSAEVEVPTFVYFIVFSLFAVFNVFALNMFLQYKKIGPWKSYVFGEKFYIFLSLFAKSLLAWQVWSGTLRGTENEVSVLITNIISIFS